MTNRNTAPAILITIPLSHYCEKARWALDRVALPYREEPHAPLLHRLATKRLRPCYRYPAACNSNNSA